MDNTPYYPSNASFWALSLLLLALVYYKTYYLVVTLPAPIVSLNSNLVPLAFTLILLVLVQFGHHFFHLVVLSRSERLVTFRFCGTMKLVPAKEYEEAIETAIQAFPALARADRENISFWTITPNAAATATATERREICKSAWKSYVARMKQEDVITILVGMTSEFERDPPPQYSEVVRSSSTSQPPRARTGSAGMYMQPSSSSPQPRSAESSTSGSRRSWFRRRFPSRASAGLGMHNPSSSSTSQSSIPDTYSKPTKIRTSAKHSLTSPGSGSRSSHSCSCLRRR